MNARDVRVPRSAMLGGDGKGFGIMMGIVLPVFNVLTATCVVGLIEAAVRKTAEHASGTRHSDTGSTLADLPTIRSYIAPALAEGVKQSV